jgi:hypothetical protein
MDKNNLKIRFDYNNMMDKFVGSKEMCENW